MRTLTVGSLFSGIGGLELGLERAGMKTLWQVEIDPYARKVLAKHWPDVERFEDVRSVGAHNLKPVDLICGGFPCQDVSRSGARAGIDGARSGLWSEFERVVREVRPRLVLVENVPGLADSGLGRVLGDLAALGFDACWSSISACAMGAPHIRARLFVVAYPQGLHGEIWMGTGGAWPREIPRCGNRKSRRDWLESEPGTRGVADGVPNRVDRIRALGTPLSLK